MPRRYAFLLTLLASLAGLPAHAIIYRCTSPDGAITYRQDPCAERESAKVIDVPASYPAVDAAERERLFVREAALDRRLEAERERWSREAIAHATQPPPTPAAAPDVAPDIVWVAPPFAFHRHRHSFAHRNAVHALRRN